MPAWVLPAARAQNVLFITEGDVGNLQAIDTTTGTVLYTVTTSAGALPIAVRATITLGSNVNSGLTGEYNPATGALIGSLQSPAGTNWDPVWDGAASATANFTSSSSGSGPYNVYQTAPDWSSPSLIFSVGIQPYGITYDTAAGTLWIATPNNFIYQYTTAGSLISSFAFNPVFLGGLAYQASTDTLWVVPTSEFEDLQQYAKDGTLLQSLTVPGRLGNIWGAEFQAVPEPSTYALIAGLGAGLLAFARRRCQPSVSPPGSCRAISRADTSG